jgi:hypothetical protein
MIQDGRILSVSSPLQPQRVQMFFETDLELGSIFFFGKV